MGNLGHQAESSQNENSEQKKTKDGEPVTRKPGSKAQGRKRTKTGCLTCRRRRIKCGEERPTCQNCHKSKRQCEGYNQRVVFKDPLNAYRGPPMSVSSQVSFSEPISTARQSDQSQQASTANPLPIAPKPGPLGLSIVTPDSTSGSALPSATTPGIERRVYSFSAASEYPTPNSGASSKPPQAIDASFDTVDRSHLPEPPRSKRSPPQQTTHYDFDALHIKKETRDEIPITPARTSPLDWSAGPTSASLSSSQELFFDSNSRIPASATFFQSYPTTSTWQQPTPISASAGPSFHEQHFDSKGQYETPHPFPRSSEKGKQSQDEYMQPGPGAQQQTYPFQATKWKAEEEDVVTARHYHQMEEDEDDPYDVSDEDIAMEEYEYGEDGTWQGDVQENHLKNNDLGIVVAMQARQENLDLRLRSFTSFIDRPNMLATYTPSPQSSPLNDSMTARLFCHFINVTAPSMSMFERHPANPSLIFHGQPVPKSQQHIWTYTFPTLAFQNQGLLHAMLALASLHIAKLQNGPIAASLKHYAIGLRRVAKSLGSPSRRGQPATLAASMLLAFYECWCADHQKWSNHLLGAKQLVREIDFAGMTKYIKSVKAQQRREERERKFQAQQQGIGGFYEDRTRYQAIVEDVDENIVGMLMGKKLRYDQYGRIMDEDAPDDGSGRNYTQRELDIYETQRDLFWWYCKQDVYQSILGGGRLFMEYDLWSHCPPRAPLGRLNSTYGTFDHLILLMGRLADFASKDIKRKRLAMKANGGWRPPGNMAMPAQQNSYQMPQQQAQMPQMPSFSGMVPGVGPPKLPMGFEQTTRDESPQSDDSNGMDLDALRIEAEEEWQEIRNAFSILEDHFGEDFQPLGPEFSPPIQTPFGTALQYRTYGIAGIWMNFYMALIACHRAHPSMPPAAMVAAGIAARQTASFANELGRIAAGIAPDCSMTAQVSPGVGAALIESATCIFVAGVQYQNAAQRAWTVNRLRDIARLTGWQTALAIASGCETSWVKVGELGRGPAYTRTSEERVVPDIWHSARRIDRALDDRTNKERQLVVERSDRVHYALGLLSVEEDFEDLDLDNDENPTGS